MAKVSWRKFHRSGNENEAGQSSSRRVALRDVLTVTNKEPQQAAKALGGDALPTIVLSIHTVLHYPSASRPLPDAKLLFLNQPAGRGQGVDQDAKDKTALIGWWFSWYSQDYLQSKFIECVPLPLRTVCIRPPPEANLVSVNPWNDCAAGGYKRCCKTATGY